MALVFSRAPPVPAPCTSILNNVASAYDRKRDLYKDTINIYIRRRQPEKMKGSSSYGTSGSSSLACCVIWVLLFGSALMAVERSEAHCSHRARKSGMLREPCRNLVLYFHDIIYNGQNAHNATSALVGAPQGANLTILTGKNHFGDLAVFDDPITLDNNLHSPPVGRAQGFYFYDMKNTFSAWLGFTFVLNSTDYKGTITFAGADPILVRSRDISVVGGTGDFLMARGIATIQTDAFEGDVYFCLRVNITLYECY